MANYDIEINENEIEYLNNMNLDNLVNDMVEMVELIDSLNIDEDEIVIG